jgi:dihydrofolate synthase / folylpolyglutamate synthase
MNYKESVDFIFGHTNYEMIPRIPHNQANYDLRRVFLTLERLGNPHLKAKSLHITGTNGKGSTSAMLASALTAAGFKTGLYTSPHLITMRERFTINGEMISEAELADIATRIRPEIEAVDKQAEYGILTVFEILTVLCFVYFAQNKCDFQVMEVGMGGRYDATNVIVPEVCLITSISYDHMEVLGDTLTKIAAEKCGIIKPGCIVVTHPQAEEAEKVILAICLEKQVPLLKVGQDVIPKGLCHDFDHQELWVEGRFENYKISIPLLGEYQLNNAAAAVAGLEALVERGISICKDDIEKGLARVNFPGRMQIISRNPFIILDGGHNPGAAIRLRESLVQYFEPVNTILVIGASGDKDVDAVVKELAPVFNTVFVTKANNPRSCAPERLAAEFAKYGIQAQITQDIPTAIKKAKTIATADDLICVTGSLFVVGEALEHINNITAGH